MRKNTTKEKLKQGQPVIGVFCNIGAPVLVEMLGALGYDFVYCTTTSPAPVSWAA